ncbi:2-hydroxyacid dehydrogenase [Plectosphaerella plurivora]|uniref:2-hydroxyacid dehydrogenase n=1 Tax=Plectosphaerella plurivora TaxID=936078 RepID=A0A9P8VBG9_9PEZI|nr:2-hydroxyacid dehydrogenase [Plectosphaerella plurivora]
MAAQDKVRILFVLPKPEPPELVVGLVAKFPALEPSWICTGSQFGEGHPDNEVYKDVNILVTLSALPPTLEEAPVLKYIHFVSSGTNHLVNHPIYTGTKLPLTTSRGVMGPPIAEWVIMTSLVHDHHYNRIRELQLQGTWGKSDIFWTSRDAVKKRIGILGYGAIGRHVGRIAKAMGMDVYVFTATPKTTPEQRRDSGWAVPNTGDPEGTIPSKWFHGLDKPSLHDFLKQDLDHVVLSLPLTPQTTGLFSTEEFGILSKKKALVSNISRGQVIDQPALIAALKEGKIRGASLDVTDPEPLPDNHELWKVPNVIVSPHVSGLVSTGVERIFEILTENLERLFSGQELVNLVRRETGY